MARARTRPTGLGAHGSAAAADRNGVVGLPPPSRSRPLGSPRPRAPRSPPPTVFAHVPSRASLYPFRPPSLPLTRGRPGAADACWREAARRQPSAPLPALSWLPPPAPPSSSTKPPLLPPLPRPACFSLFLTLDRWRRMAGQSAAARSGERINLGSYVRERERVEKMSSVLLVMMAMSIAGPVYPISRFRQLLFTFPLAVGLTHR